MKVLKNLSLMVLLALAFAGCRGKSSQLADFNKQLYAPEYASGFKIERADGRQSVLHFVKPGITGWSQVTGYRGETKELKDMEGRVIVDIWYIEHWSFWLDIYIIYKTVRNAIHGEKNAY